MRDETGALLVRGVLFVCLFVLFCFCFICVSVFVFIRFFLFRFIFCLLGARLLVRRLGGDIRDKREPLELSDM